LFFFRLKYGWLSTGSSIALTVLACAGAGNTARAQVPDRLPVLPPAGSPLPGIQQPRQPNLAPGLALPPRPEAPAESTEGPRREIVSVAVVGATAFPDAAIAPLTANLIGPAIAEGQIEASRRALVDLYRSQGYIYTTVRAIITGNRLSFQVVEGHVAEVKLEGDIGPAGVQVLRFLNHVVGQTPLKASELERWLLLAQDIPGLTVRSVLNPSLGDPGALTLVAQVSRRAVTGYVSADNRAFNLTGPSEGLGVISFNSFTEFGEQTQLSMYGALNGTNVFGQASEEVFLGGSGLKLKIYGGAGNSTPSGSLGQIGYDGETQVFGAQLTYPLLRSRAQSLNILGNFDAIQTNDLNTLGPNGGTQRSSYDSLRVLRFGADYALLDTLLGPSRSAVNGIGGKLSQGLTAFGASTNGDTWSPPPRLGEKIDFTKFVGQVSRTQTLFSPYPDATVALYGVAAGQYTAELLPPAEKFYLGGPSFNRGYYYGQVSGDKGLAMTAELRLNTPIPLPKRIPFALNAQFYTFYDWGEVWQNTNLEANVILRSAGLGVRLYVASSTEIDFEGAYRMNLYPNGSGPGVSPLISTAFYWQVLQRF
jgi:hemolysin activation/secretion protein